MSKEEGKYGGCAFALVGAIVCIVWLLIFNSCTTVRYVPVVEHRTDTVQITKQQRDSIWLHDSIYMKEYMSGDTVYMLRDRWHTKYIESIRHDTTYISKRDTIPCPYPVEVEVERQLTWWQRLRLYLGNIVLMAGVFGICIWLVKMKLRL